ncbi:hypothetical protein BDN70DRAFT_871983 [Pholiota conissans]|uniref:Uncharacterized protein n=1 Tax=Pholiota conissans TaxID=109636 RepID=A0A9P5ZE32_9AGAR|nr:hypothetical protein BDN70DRAFT_871983 [Pholiota conissans]
MATISCSHSTIIIPQEVCGIICQDEVLTQRDLYALCNLSQAFHAEAEPMLYSSVHLELTNKIRPFCRTVILRPHLIKRTRKLVLILPPQSLDPDDLLQIKKILHLSTNLRDLRVLLHSSGATHNHEEVGDWSLENYVFKLTTFVNSYFSTLDIIRFMEVQSEIKTLVMGQTSIRTHPKRLCSSLENLYCSFEELPTFGGQLKRLYVRVMSFNFTSINNDLSYVGSQFGATLTSLGLDLNNMILGGSNTIKWFIDTVAQHLPRIRLLEIIYDALDGSFDLATARTSPEFSELETVVLRPSSPASIFTLSGYYVEGYLSIDLRTDVSRMSCATLIMQYLPTPKNLVLVDVNKNISYEFNRALDGSVSFVDSKLAFTIMPLDSMDSLEAIDDDWLNKM